MKPKTINSIYWVFTILFAGLMALSAIPSILTDEDSVKILHDMLGYPVYFIPFIGVAKLLGVIAILIPGLDKIKEWAYAGLFFDLAGASTIAKRFAMRVSGSRFARKRFSALERRNLRVTDQVIAPERTHNTSNPMTRSVVMLRYAWSIERAIGPYGT